MIFKFLIEFFKTPTILFAHDPLAGEPLGVAIRNACSVYAREDEFVKLEETIKSLEQLYKP
ncbi:MAG: hypothetical protein ACTSO5_05345 [Candidatus Heimdallarchaeaceae archaeon]